MDNPCKYAYRHLLYWALVVEIRGIKWIACQPLRLLNPFRLRRELQRAARAGALADWLHNLAQFSALDFQHFDEQRFWHDYDTFTRRHGNERLDYRAHFDRVLQERLAERSAS